MDQSLYYLLKTNFFVDEKQYFFIQKTPQIVVIISNVHEKTIYLYIVRNINFILLILVFILLIYYN